MSFSIRIARISAITVALFAVAPALTQTPNNAPNPAAAVHWTAQAPTPSSTTISDTGVGWD